MLKICTYNLRAQQADIEGIIANGLQLPEVAPAFPGRGRTLPAAASADTPYLGHSMPHGEHHMQAVPMAVPVGMPGITVAPSPMAASLSLPMADATLAAPVARSHVSAVTSTSNAFEEAPDGFNFGLELFGADSWSALSHGWADMAQFPGSSI